MKENVSDISARADEIVELVINNEYYSAGARLLDFVRDFDISNRLRHEVFILHADLLDLRSDLRVYGKTEELLGRRRKYMMQILGIVEDLRMQDIRPAA